MQRVFARLGVFVHGATPELAEAVCAGVGEPADDVPGQIELLVNHKLVRAEINDASDGRVETRTWLGRVLTTPVAQQPITARMRVMHMVVHIAGEEGDMAQAVGELRNYLLTLLNVAMSCAGRTRAPA